MNFYQIFIPSRFILYHPFLTLIPTNFFLLERFGRSQPQRLTPWFVVTVQWWVGFEGGVCNNSVGLDIREFPGDPSILTYITG